MLFLQSVCGVGSYMLYCIMKTLYWKSEGNVIKQA